MQIGYLYAAKNNMQKLSSIVNLKYDKIFTLFSHITCVKKEQLQKKIGERIIKLRTQKGLSQSDLARACNKDRQAIEKIENGRVNPTLFTLLEISEALQIPLSDLVNIQ